MKKFIIVKYCETFNYMNELKLYKFYKEIENKIYFMTINLFYRNSYGEQKDNFR